MLNNTEPSHPSSQPSEKNWSNEVFSAEATSRRRALLKGMGRGAAVLAATVPIQTLAGQICPSSGMMSAQMSQGVSTSDSCPTGFAPAHWGQSTADKPAKPLNVWPNGANPSTRYKDIFTSSNNSNTLFHIMTDATESDEKHWICAWLNAHTIPKFPYTPPKVVSLANPDYRQDYANSLTFLKKYMESKVG